MKSIEYSSGVLKDKNELKDNPLKQTRRTFNYEINEQKAKKKLLKGAKKSSNLEIEIKSTCVNIRFSDGAYQKVAMPLLKEWNKKIKKPFQMMETDIEIVEYDTGVELSGRSMDAKLVIIVNGDRIVLHAYNGTQNIMLQGKNFVNFAENILHPYFEELVKDSFDIIEEFNQEVIEVLGHQNPPTKKKKISKPFNCPHCKVKSATVGDLKKHLKASHILASNRKASKTTTILNEDLSLLDESIKSLTNKPDDSFINCEWEPCGYASKDKGQLTKHFSDVHVEYLKDKYHITEVQKEFDDHNIKHTEIQTQDIIIACSYCKISVKSKEELEDHIRAVHDPLLEMFEDPNQSLPAIRESVVICGICEQGFDDEIQYTEHVQIHNEEKDTTEAEHTFKCKNCEFQAKAESELSFHQQRNHGSDEKVIISGIPNTNHISSNGDCIKCPFCTLSSQNLFTLRIHIQNIHCTEPPNINASDIIENKGNETCSKCNECKFIGSTHEMNQHLRTNHMKLFNCNVCSNAFPDLSTLESHTKSKHKVEPFPCEFCGLVLANFRLLKEHVQSNHTSQYVSCKYCDITCVNQEELKEHMISEHEDVVIWHTMAVQVNEMTESITYLKEHIKTLVDNQTEMKQELFILRNQKYKENKSTEAAKKSYAEVISSPCPRASSPSPSAPLKSRNQESPLPAFRPTPPTSSDILFVGDSITNSLDMKAIVEATEVKINKVKAYTSIYDEDSNFAKKAAKIPHQNFTDVCQKELDKKEYNTLIMQAGSVDITNFNTRENATDNFDYFHQETLKSAENLFRVAENALKNHQTLQKVIIFKQIPRYDTKIVDPLQIKAALSDIYNKRIAELWMNSSLKSKIFVGSHNIECNGGIREARYRCTLSGRYDGVHLYGPSGMKVYTNSVMEILKRAGIISTDRPPCKQFQYQNRRTGVRSTRQCHSWEQDKDIRNNNKNKKQVMGNSQFRNSNRFHVLSDDYQGNF